MRVYATREKGKPGILEVWDAEHGEPKYDGKFWTQTTDHLGMLGERNGKDVVGSYAGIKPGECVPMNLTIKLERVKDDAAENESEKTKGGEGG